MKSDFLYRLCRVITDGIYSKLKAYNDVYAKGSKQWRLIDYYRGLDRWDKRREKQDWEGENIAGLKYNTLSWLLTAMSKIGDWPHSHLHVLIGGISWALKAGAKEDLLDLIDEAKLLAWETEAYSLFEETLHLEWLTIRELSNFYNRDKRIQSILESQIELESRKQEIREIIKIRLLHFESARRKTTEQGKAIPLNFDDLSKALDNLSPIHLQAGEAQIEYYGLRLRCQMAGSLVEEMVGTADMIRKIYIAKPWMIGNDRTRYFQLQRDRILAYALAGEMKKAKETLRSFEVSIELDEEGKALWLMPKLWSYFYLYDTTGDTLFAESALEEFKKDAFLVRSIGHDKELVWLYHFVSKAALDTGDYQRTKMAIEGILERKGSSNDIIVAHGRVMMLLAQMGLRFEPEFIYANSVACSKYLHRHPNVPPYLLVVNKWISRITKSLESPVNHYDLFSQAIEEVTKEYNKDARTNAIYFRYHLALERLREDFKRNL